MSASQLMGAQTTPVRTCVGHCRAHVPITAESQPLEHVHTLECQPFVGLDPLGVEVVLLHSRRATVRRTRTPVSGTRRPCAPPTTHQQTRSKQWFAVANDTVDVKGLERQQPRLHVPREASHECGHCGAPSHAAVHTTCSIRQRHEPSIITGATHGHAYTRARMGRTSWLCPCHSLDRLACCHPRRPLARVQELVQLPACQ